MADVPDRKTICPLENCPKCAAMKREQKKYKKALKQWRKQCIKTRRRGIPDPDQPLPPTFKKHYICWYCNGGEGKALTGCTASKKWDHIRRVHEPNDNDDEHDQDDDESETSDDETTSDSDLEIVDSSTQQFSDTFIVLFPRL